MTEDAFGVHQPFGLSRAIASNYVRRTNFALEMHHAAAAAFAAGASVFAWRGSQSDNGTPR